MLPLSSAQRVDLRTSSYLLAPLAGFYFVRDVRPGPPKKFSFESSGIDLQIKCLPHLIERRRCDQTGLTFRILVFNLDDLWMPTLD